MMIDDASCPFMPSVGSTASIAEVSQLQVVDYEKTQQQIDPTSAPEKQAKIALDAAIAGGDMNQLQTVLKQIGCHLPQQIVTLMMHALRSAAKLGKTHILQVLLEEIRSGQAQQVSELMRYAIDGAAAQDSPGVLDLLLGEVSKVFQATHPLQFLELVQYSVSATAKRGNLGLLKFLMDHTATSSIPINYDDVFSQAASSGHAETLLKGAIQGGAQFENVILMLLHAISRMPENNDSGVGSRQSLKNTAKFQLVKSYKQSDPALFTKLMAAVKSYFPEGTHQVHSGTVSYSGEDIAM